MSSFKIKWPCAVFLSSLISFNASANMAEEICTYLQSQFPTVQKKLPMKQDKATSLINISADYSGHTCTLTYDYMIDTQEYAQVMASGNGLSVGQNIEWLKTDKGNQGLNETFTKIAQYSSIVALGSITQHKGIKAVYIFVFDDPDIIPIVATGADTTK